MSKIPNIHRVIVPPVPVSLPVYSRLHNPIRYFPIIFTFPVFIDSQTKVTKETFGRTNKNSKEESRYYWLSDQNDGDCQAVAQCQVISGFPDDQRKNIK